MKNINRLTKAARLISVSVVYLGLTSLMTMAQGPSTDVWIDVVKGPSLARISVTVPMTYGFAVSGTEITSDQSPITVEDGYLLISNINISVSDSGSSHADYDVQTVGLAQMPVRNYSTDVLEADFEESNPPRVGLEVLLNASIGKPLDAGGNFLNPAATSYWEPIADEPTSDPQYFKKYRIALDGKKFKNPDVDEVGWINLESDILLPAPPDLNVNGYAASGLAYIPSVSYLPFNVEVGGQRGQYHQVEQSVKVGKIRWSVEAVDQPVTP